MLGYFGVGFGATLPGDHLSVRGQLGCLYVLYL